MSAHCGREIVALLQRADDEADNGTLDDFDVNRGDAFRQVNQLEFGARRLELATRDGAAIVLEQHGVEDAALR